MTRAARTQKPKYPHAALMPIRIAADAPGNATIDEGVAGEGLASQHHEPTDDRGDDRDDGAGPEGVDHEVELEEPTDIADEVPRETGVGQRHAGHPWKCV